MQIKHALAIIMILTCDEDSTDSHDFFSSNARYCFLEIQLEGMTAVHLLSMFKNRD
jgi:hypothetical protein